MWGLYNEMAKSVITGYLEKPDNSWVYHLNSLADSH